MELREIVARQAVFDAQHSSTTPWNTPVTPETLEVLEHLIVCLVGEVGEFANIVKKVVRGDESYEGAKGRLREEIADAFIYVLKICNQTGIDLEKACLERIAFNTERFQRYEK